jgi:hypothetical protein
MKCQRGDQRGIVKIDACRFETDLCLKTLVATRGRDFPLARIAEAILYFPNQPLQLGAVEKLTAKACEAFFG